MAAEVAIHQQLGQRLCGGDIPPSAAVSMPMSMSNSDALITSFATYIRSLEAETKSMKSLYNLSSALESGNSMQLQDLVNDIGK